MEKPLISGESSSNGGRRREPHNRSDAIAHGSSYQKAAALVDLAEDGIGLPEQILDQPNFQSAAKFYFLFTQFDIIWPLGKKEKRRRKNPGSPVKILAMIGSTTILGSCPT
uniref:Uncharacterized protein n=1 Tax=Fagus sylvatica TaxID=28930 RepID=A0A2N9F0C4_FAGSY